MDGWRKRHWYIDNDVIEPLTEQTKNMSHSRFSDVHLRIQVLIGGNQANSLVDINCRAFEEQRVRPHRVFQSDAQPWPRPNTQHPCCFAVWQMKVEQRDLGLCGRCQLQCEVDRDNRRYGA